MSNKKHLYFSIYLTQKKMKNLFVYLIDELDVDFYFYIFLDVLII